MPCQAHDGHHAHYEQELGRPVSSGTRIRFAARKPTNGGLRSNG